MEINEIISILKEANIDEESSLTFKSAALIFWSISNKWGKYEELSDVTGYSLSEIEFIFYNFIKNGIFKDGVFYMDLDEENAFFELVLCAMCGAGEIRRYSPDDQNEEDTKTEIMTKKNLNQHLFETLERLSEATPETIEFEAQRAVSIIQVSQEIQSVARLKLDIIANTGALDDNFTEISSTPTAKAIAQKSSAKKNDDTDEPIEVEDIVNDEEVFDDNEMVNPLVNESGAENDYYQNTFIEKKPIPTDVDGNYITQEKRGLKLKVISPNGSHLHKNQNRQ